MEEQKKVSWGWPPNLGKFTGGLWNRYSMTGEQYRALWKGQGGLCVGCKGELANPYAKTMQEGFMPKIDYWRDAANPPKEYGPVCKVEEVRGLLCGDCRTWARKVEERRSATRNLLEYLDAYEVKRGR